LNFTTFADIVNRLATDFLANFHFRGRYRAGLPIAAVGKNLRLDVAQLKYQGAPWYSL